MQVQFAIRPFLPFIDFSEVYLQKKLFRFFLRSFGLCPESSLWSVVQKSTKNQRGQESGEGVGGVQGFRP